VSALRRVLILMAVMSAVPKISLAVPPEILSVRQASSTRLAPPAAEPKAEPKREVARYGKLELRVELKATYQNPYDPDELDLWAEFTAPSGKVWKIWGFYNPSSWSALWMVRFAPTEVGPCRYVVEVRDREGTAESKAGKFSVVDGSFRGFVRIAENKRYLQYPDGSSFYGVGLWYNDGYDSLDSGSITEEGLDSLRQRGANFISFYSSPLETMGTGLGRYDQSRAGRLDQLFEWCEEREMLISWDVWFHAYFSDAVWGGGSARYRNNPYRLVAGAGEFFGSEEAWKQWEKLLRYMVARWGYSRSLFLWFVVDEINGTEGWRDGGSEAAEQWCRRVHDWLKACDPYGRPTTGTQSGGIKEWWPGGYRIFDIAAREIYESQGHPIPKTGKPDWATENPLKFSYLNYATQAQELWKGFEKPAIVGECGYDDTYYEPGTPGYLTMYHNALWAGLANGLSATPFWWSYSARSNDSVLTSSLAYFSEFVRGIDFAGDKWKPVTLKVSEGDGWAIEGEKMAFGWVVNPASGIANETFDVPGLEDGEYEVQLYRTWRGQYLDPVVVASAGGTLTVKVPELRSNRGHAQQTGDDVAFKIVKKRAGR
jgi:hypothetical protein